jgi:phosphoglycolate phosphatase
VKKLVMWDIDRTLLHGGGVAANAWRAAFTEVTGVPWRETPIFGGRTDTAICLDVFASHGVTDCTPERFFEGYLRHIDRVSHLFAIDGALLPGVREVLTRLDANPGVVQTLVTGNLPRVAAAKVAAFHLDGFVDAEVGGYGSDDAVRAVLVERCLARAEAKYGERFEPYVIGDTVHDITAALANGAFAIGVATGATTMAELVLAGAHAVLPDLSDTDAVVRILTEEEARPSSR